MPSFNLVKEKWIPCIMLDDKRDEMGLLEVLTRAHQIREVFHPSPLVTVSLHRLLLAILHRNFGPANLEGWKTLWNKGKWDDKKLSEYFIGWERRFDLFDKERPFYQSPELPGAEKHPVLHLAMETSSGNNATLFDHSMDAEPKAVTSSVAACYVVSAQSFSIGFGKSRPFYFSDSPLIRGMTTLAIGSTLFETLALNLIVYNSERPFPWIGEDLPIWERDELPQPDRDGSPISGYLDYLTWQSRRIHLFPEGEPAKVRYCQIQQGLKLPDELPLDPFKCFTKEEKRGYVPLNIRQGRAVWRDSHTLFQTADATHKRPEMLNFLSRVDVERREGKLGAATAYRLAVIGLTTEAGKAASVLLWRHERLPLPLKYLGDEKLVDTLKHALNMAEDVGRLFLPGFHDKGRKYPRPFQELASALLPLDNRGNPDQDAVKSFVDHLAPGTPYWSQLGITFPRLVTELAEDITKDGEDIFYGLKTIPWWANEVRRAALAAFEEAVSSLDQSARVLKAVTLADVHFRSRLNSILDKALEPYKLSAKGGEE